MKKKLSPIDWAFLQSESPERLAHVAGLWVFQLPDGYRGNFFREFVDGLDDWETATPPFNFKLSNGGLELPSWIQDEQFDADYHVRYTALPKPGTQEQLMELVARIHSRQLDRARPLWECHFIEGIQGRRIALYLKMHHALIDGVSGLEFMVSALSKSPEERAVRAVWQPPVDEISGERSTGLLSHLGKMSSKLLGQVKSLPELSATVAKTGLEVLNLRESQVPAPFSAPKTPLNVPITQQRQFAIQTLSLGKVRALGKTLGATVNDVILAVCGGALRRYLAEHEALPKKPLVAWVPVSLRTGSGDQAGGNQVAVVMCSLGTHLADPRERFDAIKTSVDAAKAQFTERSSEVSSNHTLLVGGLMVLTQQLGVTDRVAPPANVVISNVPGPADPLYLNGARLVGQYPMSMLLDGQALNITITSHGDCLDFGVLACREAVPDVARIADYLIDALEEIETMAELTEGKTKTTVNRMTAKPSKPAGRSVGKFKVGQFKGVLNDLDTLVNALEAVQWEPLANAMQGQALDEDAAAKLQASLDTLNKAAAEVREGLEATDDVKRHGLNGPDPKLMNAQARLWNILMDYYFRLEMSGWERLPDRPSLLIGVHSGGPLTMDAWTVALGWWRHFGEQRALHGTAHDVLMSSPGIGTYFNRMGAVSPSRENISAAFAKGDDVVLWPGGEVDAYRDWRKRDTAVLGGRKGFIRLAIREGVPIVPVATVGGHDTLFVLSEGRGIAKALGLKKRMRVEVAPITLSVPFGVTLHLTPFQHIPLPSKIRTEFLEPIQLDDDPERANDEAYVNRMYREVEDTIQAGMDRLAKQRKFPVFG